MHPAPPMYGEMDPLFGLPGADDFAALLAREEMRRSRTGEQLTCSIGIADSDEGMSLLEVAARARRRMEVVQTVRKLRRARGGGN